MSVLMILSTMSEIYDLDVDTFLTDKENQVIENLTIYSSSAEKLTGLQYPWTLANRTSEGKLVRGLDNLKTLYVVDRSLLRQEGREKHPGNCNYILKEVVQGKAPHPGLRSGTLVPWNSGTAHVIRLALDFEETPYNPKPLSYSNTKSRYDVPYSLYLYNKTRRYFLQRVKKRWIMIGSTVPTLRGRGIMRMSGFKDIVRDLQSIGGCWSMMSTRSGRKSKQMRDIAGLKRKIKGSKTIGRYTAIEVVNNELLTGSYTMYSALRSLKYKFFGRNSRKIMVSLKFSVHFWMPRV
jgi:hypothetical protein